MDEYDDNFGYNSMVWYGEWQEWYAWYPVRLFDPSSITMKGKLTWFKRIKCRLVVTDLGRRWQYLVIGSEETAVGS